MMSNPDQERVERYEALRTELADLDDAALKERFWQLCEEVMTPVVDLARTHTPRPLNGPSYCAWASTR